MDFDKKKTRLLDISSYSSMRCTKVREKLRNSPLSSETWSKNQGDLRNRGLRGSRKQVNHTNFLVHVVVQFYPWF